MNCMRTIPQREVERQAPVPADSCGRGWRPVRACCTRAGYRAGRCKSPTSAVRHARQRWGLAACLLADPATHPRRAERGQMGAACRCRTAARRRQLAPGGGGGWNPEDRAWVASRGRCEFPVSEHLQGDCRHGCPDKLIGNRCNTAVRARAKTWITVAAGSWGPCQPGWPKVMLAISLTCGYMSARLR